MIVIGTVLSAFGFFVRFLSYRKGCAWRLVKPNRVFKEGIFKYIRHPLYCGTLIYIFGLTLAFTSNVGLAFVSLLITNLSILNWVDQEEKLMIFWFGQEYIDYMKKTKMFIPFIV